MPARRSHRRTGWRRSTTCWSAMSRRCRCSSRPCGPSNGATPTTRPGSCGTRGAAAAHNRVWMTTEGVMPDDPVLHNAALVYSSDTTVLDSIITTHGLVGPRPDLRGDGEPLGVVPSPGPVRQWVLYSTTSPVAGRLARPGYRTLLRRRRSVVGDGRQRGHRQTLPQALNTPKRTFGREDRVAHAITSRSATSAGAPAMASG